MTSMPPPIPDPPLLEGVPLPREYWPNYDNIITEDDTPMDNPYSEKQMRLLTTTLYQSWPGPGDGRPFVAMANVGLFSSIHNPPIIPDVLLSLDVRCASDLRVKPNRAYFPWEYGKPPDAVFEIVSNKEGEELGKKPLIYARLRVPYYIVWDPAKILSSQALHCYELLAMHYKECDRWLDQIGLGVTEWTGFFEDHPDVWLRWCDRAGNLLATGPEEAARLTARAEQEKARAEQEKARAEKLMAQLRAAGIEPQE